MRFNHETLGQRVRFASGQARESLAAELDLLGSARAMLIAGTEERELAERVTAGLPVVVHHDEVVMHVPTDVARRAREVATEHQVDVIVSVGGGSTTGLAKAVALTSGIPIVAVPTTYAGSEATNVWGMTESAKKTTGVDDRVLPRTVIYDASLMLSLPQHLSIASGLNALAHCVDSMWAPRADPINAALAVEGIRALNLGLPAILDDPSGLDGREQALYGAYLAAVAFASAGSGLHHKICHVLGGMFDLPHAQTHAVVLPHVLAFNVPAAPEAAERIASAFGSATAVAGLATLRDRIDAPTALRDYGMPEDGIEQAARAVVEAAPKDNPTDVTVENITTLLQAAWEGAEPR
ncbi:maleylacetate reductase [Aeromicrobium wangtongii]|uniref:Maleylacetate reductase n=1 Tax=Aeromicrobium wangtongii TaxID=2969247 RepID=A0ABY5M6Y4_9ACTN|nr:maleylacetate reductase [Aeromicrobium wangtongii]MCD9199083.1 maleylacetate reductase [Aeromicrobium wangtongii]UUP12886.1 maleylacetate reductase [Aeromicrobium wangtongii]